MLTYDPEEYLNSKIKEYLNKYDCNYNSILLKDVIPTYLKILCLTKYQTISDVKQLKELDDFLIKTIDKMLTPKVSIRNIDFLKNISDNYKHQQPYTLKPTDYPNPLDIRY